MKLRATLSAGLVGLAFVAVSSAVHAVPPAVQSKVDAYTAKMVAWAADPVVVAAAKASAGKGGVAGMNNGKWDSLAENDPAVAELLKSPFSKKLASFSADKGVSKLVLRDDKGNFIAADTKPLLYNNASRPQFANAMKGSPWHASEVKPDPTTQVKSVQLGVPVLDGGKAIAVLHMGLAVD